MSLHVVCPIEISFLGIPYTVCKRAYLEEFLDLDLVEGRLYYHIIDICQGMQYMYLLTGSRYL